MESMTSRQSIYLLLVYILVVVCTCKSLDGTTTSMEPRVQKVEDLESQVAEMQAILQSFMTKLDSLQDVVNKNFTGPELACAPGPPGRDGRDGRDGGDGRDGKDGRDGEHGKDGGDGLPGIDGVPGSSGPKGEVGPTGPPAGGATYTRWGRTSCGADATLIYVGFMGKSPNAHTGGGINYQCMVNDAEYNSAGVAVHYGRVAGTEYQSHGDGIFENEALDQNAPCAVCYVNKRTSTLMVPGKRSCPTNWTMEYEGYLMSSYYSHPNPSTYECVDKDPEYIRGEAANDEGSLIYFNKAVCTQGVHCPEYDGDKVITCAVCTQ